jgi:hypothetical protein
VVFASGLKKWGGLSALLLFLASPVSAQLQDQLSSYTGRNASGYLEPLVDAFGADLNAGLYHSAYVPNGGFHISLELLFMSAVFNDEDRTFLATTEGSFSPEQTTEAPTVVGSRKAVYVDGDASTRFAFPGGFELSSFNFAVPQLRIGSFYGTEALFRFAFFYTGNASLGNFNLYGLGLRHSISQYLAVSFPVDIAVGTFWQRFSMGDDKKGDDLVSTEAFTAGIQVSKRLAMWEPYVGMSYDMFSGNVTYQGDTADDVVDLSFESNEHFHMTFGLSFNVAFLVAHGEYNIGAQDAIALGLVVQH